MLKLILVVPLLFGCIPIIASALILSGDKNRAERREFMSRLQETNTQREIAGLEPLDWCVEVYAVDRGWAFDDPECRVRVIDYEDGTTETL